MASPATGVGTKPKKQGTATRGERQDADPLEVSLEHSRWRHFVWAALLGLVAAFLVFRLGGAPAIVLGLIIGVFAGRSGRSFILTYLRPAGTIVVAGTELRLPPRLHAPRTLSMPLDDVKHAYLLRRAIPWTTAGPLLVVETAAGTFEYPRDWFSSEADQRRLASALARKLGRI